MSNTSHSALLVMDYQEGIVSRFAGSELLDRTRSVISKTSLTWRLRHTTLT